MKGPGSMQAGSPLSETSLVKPRMRGLFGLGWDYCVIRLAEFSGLVGGAIGTVLGLLASLLITLVVARTSEPEPTKSFIEFASLLSLGYLCLVIGSWRGRDMRQVQ